MMKSMKISVLAGLLAAAVAIPTLAKNEKGAVYTPPENAVKPVLTQVDGYYRFMLGDIEITALYDGYLDIGKEVYAKHTNLTAEELDRLLNEGFSTMLPSGGTYMPVSAYLINTGKNLILMDAGAEDLFGDKVGFMTQNLKKAGYQPEQVDIILPTHMHFDHFNGITQQGKAVFPNATVYIANEEKVFWLDQPLEAAPQGMRAFIQSARETLKPYADAGKLKFYDAGREVIPNVLSVAAFGHTPGHVGFELRSGSDTLFIWGDVLHHHAIQFAVPEVAVDFDSNQQQARASRQRLLSDAAQRRIWVAGAHLPFPGIGHVGADGEGKYRWIPVEYQPISR